MRVTRVEGVVGIPGRKQTYEEAAEVAPSPAPALSVRTISAEQHLSFVRTLPSASFLQTPAWAAVKAEWGHESIGWFDGADLVGAGLVVANLRRTRTGRVIAATRDNRRAAAAVGVSRTRTTITAFVFSGMLTPSCATRETQGRMSLHKPDYIRI